MSFLSMMMVGPECSTCGKHRDEVFAGLCCHEWQSLSEAVKALAQGYDGFSILRTDGTREYWARQDSTTPTRIMVGVREHSMGIVAWERGQWAQAHRLRAAWRLLRGKPL